MPVAGRRPSAHWRPMDLPVGRSAAEHCPRAPGPAYRAARL